MMKTALAPALALFATLTSGLVACDDSDTATGGSASTSTVTTSTPTSSSVTTTTSASTSTTTASTATGGTSKPFVLVHGAFMGAWGWDAVKAGLESHGRTVSVVELPAHGDDTTPVSGATLGAYVTTVGDAIDAAGEPVILVGHSMGGMVISQAAEEKTAQINELVYVGALLPKDGDSLQALASQDTTSHLGPAITVDQANGVAKLPSDQLVDIFCADCATAEADAIVSHYRDEPLVPLVTPVHLTDAAFGSVPKFYVYTHQDNAVTYLAQQAMTDGVTLAGTVTLETSHAPFLSAPDDLVSALLSF